MKLLKCTALSALRQDRGWSVEPVASALLGAGGVKNIHLVSMQPGTIRGNHVHERQSEWVVTFGGRCLAAALDAQGRREERVFGPDELVLIEIPPGVPHAFKNTGREVGYLLALCSEPYIEENSDRKEVRVL